MRKGASLEPHAILWLGRGATTILQSNQLKSTNVFLLQMSAHDLATELAPVLVWPRPPVVLDSPSRTFSFRRSSPSTSPSPSKHASPRASNGPDRQLSAEAEVLTLNDDAPAVLTPSHIPLDDATPEEHAIRAAVQCMIEKFDIVFGGIDGPE